MKCIPSHFLHWMGVFLSVGSVLMGEIKSEGRSLQKNEDEGISEMGVTGARAQSLKKPALFEGTQSVTLPEVVVSGEAEYEGREQSPFLPAVQGTKIYSGKKASVIDLDGLPKVHANNYRQALAKTPGLLYSEETTPLVSLGYRGIGEPHRTQFIQVLKDGIPIHADMFGYPEAYYTPPLDVVDRLEFLRGGSGLMYGPQPGGALNYVTYMPRTDREFSARTQHVFGSDNLYSTYSAVDGTVDRVGYLAYFNHRESDGFRIANSDYVLDGGSLKLVLDANKERRLIFCFDVYEEEHGEPGGLTFASGGAAVNYNANRDAASRQFDRFRLRRYQGVLTYEQDLSTDTLLISKTWGGYYDRWSKRQLGGGFGTLPTGAASLTNDIERGEFYSWGVETRLRHDWEAWNQKHTFTGGFLTTYTTSPRTDKRGTSANAEDGVTRRLSYRETIYGSWFAENKFTFGDLSVVPGFRLENLAQSVSTEQMVAPTSRREGDDLTIKPLVSLGASYDLKNQTEVYANVSQSYRPTIYTEALVLDPTATVRGDIEESNSWMYEVGYRGTPQSWLDYDTSLFLVDLDNKLGTIGGVVQNVGRSWNYGWDAAVDLDLFGVYSEVAQSDFSSRFGSFSLYGSTTLMSSEIISGAADGNDPQYAPDYQVRSGVIYKWKDRLKLAFLGTLVADQYADDSRTANRHIPSYMVWDLTAEWKVYKDYVSLVGGINNLLDEDYYTRIRGDGIDPAYGRNFYVGIGLQY